MAAAPMVLLSSAGAVTVPPAPAAVTGTPINGPAGTSVSVTATPCGTAAEPATSGVFYLTGTTIPATATNPGTAFPGTVSAGQVLTGTVTIPSTAAEGNTFTILARCNNATGQGTLSTVGAPFTVTAASILPPIAGTSTSGATGTSGTTTSPPLTDTTATGGGTTAVAVPITQQPTFTG